MTTSTELIHVHVHDDDDDDDVRVVENDEELRKYGIVRAQIPDGFDSLYWAQTLSQVTPMIMFGEGDGDYAFYRNIVEEPDFPFQMLFQHFSEAFHKYFGINNTFDGNGDGNVLRLDDAFCVHYNMTQNDTTGAKHTDPSDITINLCLWTSDELEGSLVRFHGTESLLNDSNSTDASDNVTIIRENGNTNDGEGDDVQAKETVFDVRQKKGYATLHWGHHPHETTALRSGERTNIILTYCFKDPQKHGNSNVADRSCYFS
mmetsp:Transcript_8900/g.11846  ORF Transcript_8900/g.11846 Transcript_8900/m.11846 type:complete len:260 (-) Transcript_8900:26-805(-)